MATIIREKNDCTVWAVHKATGIAYPDVIALFAAEGRRKGRGARTAITLAVLKKLGFLVANVTERYAHIKTVRASGNRLPESHVYLVQVANHILCIRNGVVEDWSAGRVHRVKDIWALYRVGEAKPETGKIRAKSFAKVSKTERKKRRSVLD